MLNIDVLKYVPTPVNSDSLVAVNDTNNYEFDDKLLDEWHEFLQDYELYEMIVDSMSSSHLESSALEEKKANDPCNDVMPPAVLKTVENMALDHWWLISNINMIDWLT